jgi:hypothetical protein
VGIVAVSVCARSNGTCGQDSLRHVVLVSGSSSRHLIVEDGYAVCVYSKPASGAETSLANQVQVAVVRACARVFDQVLCFGCEADLHERIGTSCRKSGFCTRSASYRRLRLRSSGPTRPAGSRDRCRHDQRIRLCAGLQPRPHLGDRAQSRIDTVGSRESGSG